MKENPNPLRSLTKSEGQAVIPLEHRIVSPKEILKDEIAVVTFWLGRRAYDNSDLDKFNVMLVFRQFSHYAAFELPDADEFKEEPYPALLFVDRDIRKEFTHIKNPLAIFIITTPRVAEMSWVNDMPEGLRQIRLDQGSSDIFVYKIIMTSGIPFKQGGDRDPNRRFSRNAMRAHELGALYLPYHHDYPSVGMSRLVEFMNRVMGADLPSEYFPDYSFEELQKIEWHINKEDFNMISQREDALPKYPIVNGRPQFAF